MAEDNKVNESNLNLTDVMNYMGRQLDEGHGIKLNGKKLKDVFVEALLRNIVANEIHDMMLFIADESKWDEEMKRRDAR